MHPCEQTRKQLIEDNMKLVYFVVHKYYPTYSMDEDLIQTGMIGLCRAVDTWDSEKSKFSTYATTCIRNEIRKEFRKRQKFAGEISLSTTYQNDGDVCELQDLLIGDNGIDTVDDCSFDKFLNSLNERELEIVRLKEQGFVESQISDMLGVSRQTINRNKRTIKRKWSAIYG